MTTTPTPPVGPVGVNTDRLTAGIEAALRQGWAQAGIIITPRGRMLRWRLPNGDTAAMNTNGDIIMTVHHNWQHHT